jgi:hypothetical protein
MSILNRTRTRAVLALMAGVSKAPSRPPARRQAAAPERPAVSILDRARTWASSVLMVPISNYTGAYAYAARVNLALARGALTAATRSVDPLAPATWEFAAFSQNGEDGIIDHLLSLIGRPNRYFLEIGASDGLENNSAYLAFARKYAGVMVEGDEFMSRCARTLLAPLNGAVDYINLFVETSDVPALIAGCRELAPDLFSLDIDGNDYHVAAACLAAGLRPKVICVEYNSAFGPDRALTVPYLVGFDHTAFHESHLYYGVSIRAWRSLLEGQGYRFVTVETNGVNAFFVDPSEVALPEGVEPLQFAEIASQFHATRTGWRGQFEHVKNMPYLELD